MVLHVDYLEDPWLVVVMIIQSMLGLDLLDVTIILHLLLAGQVLVGVVLILSWGD